MHTPFKCLIWICINGKCHALPFFYNTDVRFGYRSFNLHFGQVFGNFKQIGRLERCRNGLPNIKYGDKGWAVRSAQGMLIAHKFNCGPDGADGDFGFNTKNATINFQKKYLLLPDGIIGPKTWTVLLTGVME